MPPLMLCVMDAAGKIVAEFTVERSAGGIAVLIRRLVRSLIGT